jgi:hypothetical protein
MLGCTLVQDNFFFWENETGDANITLHIYVHLRTGFFGIGFGNTPYDTNSKLILMSLDPCLPYQSTNTTSSMYINSPFSFSCVDDIEARGSNYMHFDITAPPSLFNTKYVYIFRTDPYATNTSLPVIDYAQTRLNAFFNSSIPNPVSYCNPSYFKVPGRILAYHPISFLIAFIAYGIALVFIVYYRDTNPMKARSIVPAMITFVFALDLLCEFISIYAFTFEQERKFECFVSSFVVYPSFQMIVAAPVLIFIRYLSILNVNIAKSNMNKAGYNQLDRKYPFYIKILNIFRNDFVIGILPIIFYANFCIISLILYFALGFTCIGLEPSILRYIHFGIVSFFSLICIGVLAYDYINNFKRLIRCKLREHFITYDHYYFRAEYTFIGIALMWGIGWLVAAVYSGIMRMIMCELLFITLWWVGCGFSLLNTFVSDITGRCRSKLRHGQDTQMERVLNDTTLSGMFLIYAENEWSAENFYFQESVAAYKRSGMDGRYAIAKNIMSTYLIPAEAIYEININKAQFDEINEKLQKMEDRLPDDLFATVEVEVMKNLAETFSRFVLSHEYKVYLSKLKMLGIDLTAK